MAVDTNLERHSLMRSAAEGTVAIEELGVRTCCKVFHGG